MYWIGINGHETRLRQIQNIGYYNRWTQHYLKGEKKKVAHLVATTFQLNQIGLGEKDILSVVTEVYKHSLHIDRLLHL